MPTSRRDALPDLRALRPARVCLIKPSALGDVVNAFPCLSALRALWPSAGITWVINRGLRGLVDGHPEIDSVIAYDRGRAGGLINFGRLFRELRTPRFDLTIDLQGLLRSGLMTAATAAPVRIGLSDAREGAVWFYTHRVVPPGSRQEAHAVDRLLSVALAFGADVARPRAVVAVGEADRDWARRALAGLARPRLGLNLGARWETKRWPPAHFAEVARRAVAARGTGLFAVGAPEDRPLVAELATRLDPIPVVDLCGRTTLPQLAALAGESDLFLSNDTGPLHLFAAAGARVVGVYTCTRPSCNGPYGPRAATVRTNVWCAGSYLVACPRHLECMDELTPDRVWPVVLSQLDLGAGCSAP
jgi:lipopolysaccharide heptosyltransferase II